MSLLSRTAALTRLRRAPRTSFVAEAAVTAAAGR
jgi:hypothetical protein